MRKIGLPAQAALQLGFVLVGIFVLLPIASIVRLAFDGTLQGAPTSFSLFPKEFTLAPFFKVWESAYQGKTFLDLLGNSLIVSLGSAFMAVGLGASLAYAFARFRFPGRQAGLFVLLLTAVLPAVAFSTPLFVLLTILKIRTTLLGLMLVYAAFAMPFCIWSMRAAFQAVPKEIEEAAHLDGAGHLTTFLSVTLPLALPSIAVASLIAFLMGYSEFTIGWLFVDRASNVTLAMAVYTSLASGWLQPWSILGALAILMSAPVVVIFILFQRTLLEQMLFGSASE